MSSQTHSLPVSFESYGSLNKVNNSSTLVPLLYVLLYHCTEW
jgi:hypothetical protein